jgi:hypothetical protein
LKEREKVPAKTLIEFMDKHELNRKQVAGATHTQMRSVSRWKVSGIPVAEWELLQGKIK